VDLNEGPPARLLRPHRFPVSGLSSTGTQRPSTRMASEATCSSLPAVEGAVPRQREQESDASSLGPTSICPPHVPRKGAAVLMAQTRWEKCLSSADRSQTS